jgi:hypothetical protein
MNEYKLVNLYFYLFNYYDNNVFLSLDGNFLINKLSWFKTKKIFFFRVWGKKPF